MFENLSEKLQRAFKTLRGQAVLNEENIQEALRQIRLALLEADVNFKVVKQLIDQIQAKAVGQEVMTALAPGELLTAVELPSRPDRAALSHLRFTLTERPPSPSRPCSPWPGAGAPRTASARLA